MKLVWKNVPSKIKARIKYLRGEGYKIKLKDGTLSAETYYSKVGAAAMLLGVWDILE